MVFLDKINILIGGIKQVALYSLDKPVQYVWDSHRRKWKGKTLRREEEFLQ